MKVDLGKDTVTIKRHFFSHPMSWLAFWSWVLTCVFAHAAHADGGGGGFVAWCGSWAVIWTIMTWLLVRKWVLTITRDEIIEGFFSRSKATALADVTSIEHTDSGHLSRIRVTIAGQLVPNVIPVSSRVEEIAAEMRRRSQAAKK